MRMRWPLVRMLVALVASVVLIVLLYWQHRTQRIVAECLALGGTWDGPAAVCQLPPGRILMPEEIRRG